MSLEEQVFVYVVMWPSPLGSDNHSGAVEESRRSISGRFISPSWKGI